METIDLTRIESLHWRVLGLMIDGQYRTFREIQTVTGGSENGIAARLRAFRSTEHGGYEVQRRRRGDPVVGLFEYRVLRGEPCRL